MACEKCTAIAKLPLEFFNPPSQYSHRDESGESAELYQSFESKGLLYRHWDTLQSLQESSGRGCQGCVLLLNALGPEIATNPESQRKKHTNGITLRSVQPAISKQTAHKVSGRFCHPLDNLKHVEVVCHTTGQRGNVEFYIGNDGREKIPSWHAAIVGRQIHQRSDEGSCMGLANLWKYNCSFNHRGTCLPTPFVPTKQPRRVIDVGSENSPHNLYLYDNSSGMVGSYGVLSTFWNPGDDVPTTTKENLESRKTTGGGFPLSSLPPAFQDAILIARSVSIRYLWIESLCIIQNDEEDRVTEEAQMQKYFDDAEITILATHIQNPSERIHISRAIGPILKLQVEDPVTKGSGHIYMRRAVSPVVENMAASAANTRVGPRVLEFGAQQMSWRCTEERLWESHAEAVPEMVEGNAKKMKEMWDNYLPFGPRSPL